MASFGHEAAPNPCAKDANMQPENKEEMGITIPFGWKRVVTSGSVVYVSPSGVTLCSLHEVSLYLVSEGTCKCGLECPFSLDGAFSFNPLLPSREWQPDPGRPLCNHKRKILAMATLGVLRKHTMQVQRRDAVLATMKKRPRSKSRNPFDSVLVSQLLAQRDKINQQRTKAGGPSKPNFTVESPAPDSSTKPSPVQDIQNFKVRNPYLPPDSTTVQDRKQDLLLEPQQFSNFFGAHQQFLQNGSAGITLNCNFPPTSPQLFNATQLGPNIIQADISTMAQSHNPGTFLLPQQQQIGCLTTNQQQQIGCLTTNQQQQIGCLTTNQQQQIGCLTTNQQQQIGCLTTNQQQPSINSCFSNQQNLGNCPPNVANCVINQQGIVNCIPNQQGIPNNMHPQNTALQNQPNVGLQNINNCIPNQQGINVLNHQGIGLPNQQNFNLLNPQAINGCLPNPTPVDSCLPNSQYISNNPLSDQQQMATASPMIPSMINEVQSFVHREETAIKVKKRGQKKLNCILDRASPCPNIDVRQIPSEHHRPPPEAFFQMPDGSIRPQLPVSIPCRTQNNVFYSDSGSCRPTFPPPYEAKNFQSNSFPYQDSASFTILENNRPHNSVPTQGKIIPISSQQLPMSQPMVINSLAPIKDTTIDSQIPNMDDKKPLFITDGSCKSIFSNINAKLPDTAFSSSSYISNKLPSVTCPPTSMIGPLNAMPNINNSCYPSPSNVINIPSSTPQTQICATNQHPNIVPQLRHINPVIYHNGSQRADQPNFFVQNTNMDGTIQQDSGIMVQQILSQKITSDFSGNNMFQSRAQVVQQVGGMVNPQQLLQVRMPSGSGGLITMLPSPTMTTSPITQTQMVLPDNLRQGILQQHPQQPILQNNCFIMSSQPAFVARPPNVLNSPCGISPQNIFPRPPEKIEQMPQQITGDLSTNPGNIQIVNSMIQQRVPCPKVEDDSFCWSQKQEGKNLNESPFFGGDVQSHSNLMPSNNIHAGMISNCGQVIPIMGPNSNPIPPLSSNNVTAVTTTMTQVLPTIGIAPQILGQQVQPMVQVINTMPFNSMQNAVIVPGGSNMLQQTVLQTSPTMMSNPFNGMVIPPNCVSSPSIRPEFDGRGTPGSNPSPSTSAPASSGTDGMQLRAMSPAMVRKRPRDGKRKTNSQTVASMLQQNSNNNAANLQRQQQQQQQQVQQQFLQPPPMLQALTVMPQRPMMNYGGPQILTSPLGIVQPLGMLGMGPTVIQNIPMGQVVPAGPPFQSLTVLQPQDQQPVVVNEGVHPSAFAAGSIVPNVMATNVGTEMIITSADGSQQATQMFQQQPLPPVAQPLSSTPNSHSVRLSRTTHAATPCTVTSSGDETVSSATGYCTFQTAADGGPTARSIGVQSSEEASVQTVSSTVAAVGGSPTDRLKFDGENSSTLMSSGGESCESPWPDPVNLSAAVRAVVQEQVDSNEELMPLSGFLDCTAAVPSSSTCGVAGSVGSCSDILDLRTAAGDVEGAGFSQAERRMKRLRSEMELLFDDDEETDDEDTGLSGNRLFSEGDLVWGQIRGYPSWPGKLVTRSTLGSQHRIEEEGKLWVQWFGNHSITQVDPGSLKTLSEGLEAHHRARKRHRRGRKMNAQLENAIQEAMMELDRQSRR